MEVEHLTFTGTQQGMTLLQFVEIIGILRRLQPKMLHHGGCIGADKQVHWLITNFFPDTRLHIHYSNIKEKTSGNLPIRGGDKMTSSLPPLIRNQQMVDISGWVIGAPAGRERLRSGTWSTLRYADKKFRHQIIVYPDGEIQERIYG